MSQYVQQFKHNENFHDCICKTYNNQYFDWKITCLFYCAYHLLQALAEYRDVVIGNRHSEILWNCKPQNRNRPLQIKSDAFYAFDEMFEYSRTARYDGFIDFETFQVLKKADYDEMSKRYRYFRKYVVGQGVKLD